MLMPFVGEFHMSVPKVSYPRTYRDGQTLQGAPSKLCSGRWSSACSRRAEPSETRASVSAPVFCSMWRVMFPSPGALSLEATPPVLPIGRKTWPRRLELGKGPEGLGAEKWKHYLLSHVHPQDSPGKNNQWAALSFSRGSSQPRDWAHVSCTAGGFLTT